VLDDELSVCLTLLLFSVGKVVSVVLDALDDELLFAQELPLERICKKLTLCFCDV